MRGPGYRRVLRTAISLFGLFGSMTQLHAHPHVWVSVSAELVFTGGSISEIRVSWIYDRLSSVVALRSRGWSESTSVSRDELAPLAQDTIEALRPHGFFTIARVDGARQSFEDPVEGWLEYKDSTLTLHTKLRFGQPLETHNFTIEIFDETNFIDFAFQENTAVSLVNAPGKCVLIVAGPRDTAAQRDLLGEAYLSTKVPPKDWNAQFSNKVSVRCQQGGDWLPRPELR